jgi:hypothetical protein
MTEMNFQNDLLWKHKEMCPLPFLNGNNQQKPDIIGNIGCAMTVRANIIQLATNRKFSPDDLNDDLREKNQYWGMSRGIECPINCESYMEDSYFARYWGLSYQYELPATSYSRLPNTLWEIRFKHYGVRHSSNILNDILINGRPYFIILNTWNRIPQTIPFSEAIHINKITY